MRFFDSEPTRPPTKVQFIRRPNLVAFPISFGPDGVTIGLSDGQPGPGAFAVYIPAHETRVILWPEHCDHWTLDGIPHAEPQWFQPAAIIRTTDDGQPSASDR